jgi:hypothetical protein
MKPGALLKLLLSGAVMICMVAGSSMVVHAKAKPMPVNPAFQSILPALARTHVPAYLPTVFPEAAGKRLYATVQQAVPGRYQITVDYTPGCHGADACHYGDLMGRQRAASAAAMSGTRVALGGRLTGYLVLGTCGASCAESTISWAAGSYSYSVGAKLSRADLIVFARSAVTAGAYPPPASR